MTGIDRNPEPGATGVRPVRTRRWFRFADRTVVRLSLPVPGAGGRALEVGAFACAVSVEEAELIVPFDLHAGTAVRVPLQTIHGDTEAVGGRVASAEIVRDGAWRVRIRFDAPIDTARFAVCWGVRVEPDGALTEIAAPARALSAVPDEADPRRAAERARARKRAEHMSMLITVANELAARAAAGASDRELREITGVLDALLAKGDQPAA